MFTDANYLNSLRFLQICAFCNAADTNSKLCIVRILTEMTKETEKYHLENNYLFCVTYTGFTVYIIIDKK